MTWTVGDATPPPSPLRGGLGGPRHQLFPDLMDGGLQLDRHLALAPVQGDELLDLAAQHRERVLVGRVAVVVAALVQLRMGEGRGREAAAGLLVVLHKQVRQAGAAGPDRCLVVPLTGLPRYLQACARRAV